MPTNTYVALDTKTIVGSSTSSVTFTSIPQGYTDLVIVVNGSNNTGDSEIAIRTGNGSVNTGSVYSTTFLFGNGSSPGSSRTSNRTWADAARTDTTMSTSIIHIMNYSNTTTNKTILARGSNSTLAIATVSLVRDTAAINTVQLAAHYDATFNFTAGTTFTIYGIAAAAPFAAKATGGTISYSVDGYAYHTFTSNGTFTPSTTLSCDVLVIGGGGGGGTNGGGGSAGTVAYATAQSLTTAQTVTVGSFGAGGFNGSAGSTSSLGSTSAGGGAGGAYSSTFGGSGAGGSNSGANGGPGTNAYSTFATITGTGVSGFYAGGGGSSSFGAGGSGGGGTGSSSGTGSAGAANTGSGGGGGGFNGGPGGSGIVIVRYAI